MTRLETRDLGASAGRCACCGEQATLRLVETRVRRAAFAFGRIDPQPCRTATCSACRQTYPVRSTDDRPDGAAGRFALSHVRFRPARGAHRIGAGRDWAPSRSA